VSQQISVLLADDHTLLRQTLQNWLLRTPDIHVIATAPDADQALQHALDLKPDVVVMDIDMPGLHCFDAADTILTRCPDTRVLFLSAHHQDRYIEAALRVGASGYITKAEPAEVVIQAIRSVAAGAAYFSPEVQSRLVFGPDGVTLGSHAQSRASTLTPQQTRILRYLARGMSKKEIAKTVHLSESTVNRHCENLMARLDIHDRVELARFAIREGLAEP
jgi:DNA-binding NarL/FixJ family response regulator